MSSENGRNPKLYEILAAEGDRKRKAEIMMNEAKAIFHDRPHHFTQTLRTLELFDCEENAGVPESARRSIDEKKDMTTTVSDKLAYLAEHVASFFDVRFQKECGNQVAKADVIVDGVTLIKDAPGTYLLGLESHLAKLRVVFLSIPTHRPGVKWVADDQHEHGDKVLKTETPVEEFQTRKDWEARILFRPTKNDPSSAGPTQVEKIAVTKNVGRYVKEEWSGMYSSKQKSDLLARLDTAIEEVKKARMRANDVEIKPVKCGDAIMDFVLGK